MSYLGYFIAVLGVVLIIIGVVGAAFNVFTERGKGFVDPSDTVVSILKLLPDLINALAKAPKWLSMTIVGIILVWIGRQLAVGAWPFA